MYTTTDRRAKPRVSCDYPAIIEGIDIDGAKFNDQVKLCNLSATGLYTLANRYVENGSQITVTIQLCNSFINEDAPKLSTSGIVVRTEPQQNGTYGVAVKFHHYRFQ